MNLKLLCVAVTQKNHLTETGEVVDNIYIWYTLKMFSSVSVTVEVINHINAYSNSRYSDKTSDKSWTLKYCNILQVAAYDQRLWIPHATLLSYL